MKGIYTVDKSGRLTLGREFVGKVFSLSVTKDGTIHLIPGRFIPDHEAWLYQNKEALASVKRGLAQAAQDEGVPLPFDLKDDNAWLNDDRETNDAVPTSLSTRSTKKSRSAQNKRVTKPKSNKD